MPVRIPRVKCPIAILFLFLLPGLQYAQCPTIEAIMVEPCGAVAFDADANNEFIVINSGGGFNTNDFQLSFDMSNNIISAQNNDVNIDIDNLAGDPTPCGITTGDPTWVTGCPNIIVVGANYDIPPNAIAVFQASAGGDFAFDFSSLCGAGECIYLFRNSCARDGGGFTNDGSGTRETILAIASTSCFDSYVYDRALLDNNDGAYWLPGPDTYGNSGCAVPPGIGPAPSQTTFNNPGDQEVCGGYVLPTITGTNLTGNESYYTMSGGGGTQLLAGNSIGTTSTVYIFDTSTPCAVEESFDVTVNIPPNAQAPGTFLEICHDNPVTNFTVLNEAAVISDMTFGVSGYTIEWWFDNGATMPLDLTDAADIDQVVNLPMPIEIFASVDDGTCFVGPFSVAVTSLPAPTAPNGMLSGCPNPVNASLHAQRCRRTVRQWRDVYRHLS